MAHDTYASRAGRRPWTLLVLICIGGCTTVDPVNVAGGVFFNQLCAQSHVVYQVPAGKLLIIEDASAAAFDAASATIPGAPGLVDDVFVDLSLRTNPSGMVDFGSADHVIVAGRGLPLAGGRTLQAYAAPGTDVLYLIGGCTVAVNTQVWFSGRLIDSPAARHGTETDLLSICSRKPPRVPPFLFAKSAVVRRPLQVEQRRTPIHETELIPSVTSDETSTCHK